MPAARHRSRSPIIACAVMAMIGIRRPPDSVARMAAGRLEPVHFRHLHVHQDDVELCRACASTALRPVSATTTSWPQRSSSRWASIWLTLLSSTSSTFRLRPPAAAAGRSAAARGDGRRRGLHQLRREMERAAAFAALDPDQAAEYPDQVPADRQAQAGSAELARGRSVRLAERLEDDRVLLRRDADARIAARQSARRSARRRPPSAAAPRRP